MNEKPGGGAGGSFEEGRGASWRLASFSILTSPEAQDFSGFLTCLGIGPAMFYGGACDVAVIRGFASASTVCCIQCEVADAFLSLSISLQRGSLPTPRGCDWPACASNLVNNADTWWMPFDYYYYYDDDIRYAIIIIIIIIPVKVLKSTVYWKYHLTC